MTMSVVYSQLSGHKWYVYIDKKKFIHITCIIYVYTGNVLDHKRCVYIDKSLFTSKVWKIVDRLTK